MVHPIVTKHYNLPVIAITHRYASKGTCSACACVRMNRSCFRCEGDMNNRIVARFQDGRTLKGIGLDIDPLRPTFHVRPAPGQAVTVNLADLKAIFFVRSLDGDPKHQETLTPDPEDARGRS